jgi:flagellar protein FlaG
MVSEISNITAGGAGAAMSRPPAPSVSTNASAAHSPAPVKRPDVSLPDKPAIALPKRPELQFNAAENKKNLQEAVAFLNQQVTSQKSGLGFSLNDHIDVPVVTVRNTVTGEVIRQIPNEVVLRVAENIDTVKKGLLHNSKV